MTTAKQDIEAILKQAAQENPLPEIVVVRIAHALAARIDSLEAARPKPQNMDAAS